MDFDSTPLRWVPPSFALIVILVALVGTAVFGIQWGSGQFAAVLFLVLVGIGLGLGFVVSRRAR